MQNVVFNIYFFLIWKGTMQHPIIVHVGILSQINRVSHLKFNVCIKDPTILTLRMTLDEEKKKLDIWKFKNSDT